MVRSNTCKLRPLAALASAITAFSTTAASAQQAPPAESSAEAVVQVRGTVGERKDATASKQVIGREEIVRFGDTNVTAVLRRIPGITVSDTPGQASEIRMRGLGGGYTQFLVNGEKVATGFSIDSISPDLIERIEVIRSATADESTQAVAGTLNIILKKSVRPGQSDIKASVSAYQGLVSENLSGQYGNSEGALSYAIAASIKNDKDVWPSVTQQSASEHGVLRYARTTVTTGRREQQTLSLTPRLGWKFDQARNLSIDGLLQLQHFNMQELDHRYTSAGAAPEFVSDRLNLANDSVQARITEAYKAPLGSGRLEQKAVFDFNRRTADGLRRFFSDQQMEVTGLDRQVDSVLLDRGLTLTGRYAMEIDSGHTLALGWNGQYTKRSENRDQRESSPVDYPTNSFVQDYDAIIKRLALFVQDEWNLATRVSAYAGVRWEGLRTDTEGTALAAVHNSSNVVSPTMQLIWKLPETKADQLRVSLGRTYKAPTAKDLIPRLWQVADVTPTSPNFRGNPDLRPELSWGLDVGYERYMGEAGFIGVSAYARRIDNVILQRLFQENGMWITTPFNSGQARVAGVELEFKGKLRALSTAAPDIDLRFGANANRSTVDSLPGPGNRLNQQVPLSASLGLDYRAGTSWVFGGNATFERGVFTRLSRMESSTTANRRSADLYALWRIDPKHRLRFTLSHTAGPDNGLRNRYDDGVTEQQQSIRADSVNVVRILLEKSL